MAGKKSTQGKNKQNHKLIFFLFIAISIFLLFSLISQEMGIVGDFFQTGMIYLFGKAHYAFPLVLLCVGIIGLSFYEDKKIRIFLPVWIAFIGALILLDIYNEDIFTLSQRSHFSTSYAIGGGMIGYFLGNLFRQLFGKVGTWVILIGLFFISLYGALSKMQREKIQSWMTLNKKERKTSLKENKERIVKSKKTSSPKEETINSSKDVFQEDREDRKEPRQFQDLIVESVEPEKVKPITKREKDEFQKEIIDTNLEPSYIFPPVELLDEATNRGNQDNDKILENAEIIERTLEEFHINCKVSAINRGPSVTSYELKVDPGVKLSKIASLSDNLALSLASSGIRIEAPIPGKSAVGIEVPNRVKSGVVLRELIDTKEFKNLSTTIPLTLGKDVSGNIMISSLDQMPHLLIAGATGSGKSVCINSILISLLYKSTPEEVRMILIDPKIVELGIYNKIPHLLIPVVTNPKKAAFALGWAVEEMEKRYKKFAEMGTRDITGYNQKIEREKIEEEKLPKIVIVVDELSDLMMVSAKEVEDSITRLAQMARAAGIHLILATQRPSVDVITGTIKANIPSRISFAVSSQIDSRTILDISGAEKLLGKGDMLFYPSSYPKPKRVQGAFISDEEVERVLSFIENNSNEVTHNDEIIESMEHQVNSLDDEMDPLLKEAIEVILTQEQASISFLQRKLKVGYSRAARIVDELEELGILGPRDGSKPRKLLLTEDQIKEIFNDKENI